MLLKNSFLIIFSKIETESLFLLLVLCMQPDISANEVNAETQSEKKISEKKTGNGTIWYLNVEILWNDVL